LIAKIMARRGAAETLGYVFRDDKAPDVVAGNMGTGDTDHHIEVLESAIGLRPDIKNPVWHCSLSLRHPDTAEKWAWHEIAELFMKEMGFGDSHLWVAVRHHDTRCDHIHLVACRVDTAANGMKVWRTHNDYYRAEAACAKIEAVKRLGLTVRDRSRKKAVKKKISTELMHISERTGEEPRMDAVQDAIDSYMLALEKAGGGGPEAGGAPEAGGICHFVRCLGDMGIEVRPVIFDDSGVAGISYCLAGIPMRGGALGTDYTWRGLEERGLRYSPEEDLPVLAEEFGIFRIPRGQVQAAIDSVLSEGGEGGTGTADFIRRMNSRGIAVKARVLNNGLLYGFEYEAGGVSFADTFLERDYKLVGLRLKGLAVPGPARKGQRAGAAAKAPARTPAKTGTAAGAAPSGDAGKAGRTAGPAPSREAGPASSAGPGSARQELEELAAAACGADGDASGARNVLGSRILRAVRSQFSKGRVSLPDFMLGMERLGIRVVPNIQSTGNVCGISFAVGGFSVKASDLKAGRKYGWKAVCEEGVDYDPLKDAAAVRAVMKSRADGAAEGGGEGPAAAAETAVPAVPDVQAGSAGTDAQAGPAAPAPDGKAAENAREAGAPKAAGPEPSVSPGGSGDGGPDGGAGTSPGGRTESARREMEALAAAAFYGGDGGAVLGSRILGAVRSQFSKGRVTLTDFMLGMERLGVRAVPNIQSTGNVCGISFAVGRFSVKASDLKAGKKYGWKAVCEEGVDYDPLTDASAVRAVMKSWAGGATEGEGEGAGPAAAAETARLPETDAPGVPDVQAVSARPDAQPAPDVKAAENALEAGAPKAAGPEPSVSRGGSGDSGPDGGTADARREMEALAAAVFNAADGEDSGASDVLRAMILRAVRSQFSNGRVTLTDFMLGMESLGVKAVPNIQSSGNVCGLSFRAGGVSVKASDLKAGKKYGWKAVCEEGVDYDPLKDAAAVRAVMTSWVDGAAEGEARGRTAPGRRPSRPGPPGRRGRAVRRSRAPAGWLPSGLPWCPPRSGPEPGWETS
jgi:hypothetical protein